MISLRTPNLGPLPTASAEAILARAQLRVTETPCLVVTDDNSEFWQGSQESCERWITWQLADEEHIHEWQNIDVDPMEFRVIDNTIERVLQTWGYSL